MSEVEGFDVVDVGAMEGVHQHSFVRFEHLDPTEGHFWEEWRRPEMTTEQRQKMEDLLGDGMATVTVGTDMKTSTDFGNAAGCSVYVKLTCNQDEETIAGAHAFAEELALKFMDEGHAKACRILNAARGLPDPGDAVESRAGAPAKAKRKVTSKPDHEVADTSPGKKKKVTKSGPATKVKTRGTMKPSFRRS